MSEKNPSRLRLFLENFFVYGMSAILLKLVPVVMLPIMTRLLPNTADYGVVDLYSTVVSFGITIGCFGMHDSIFRYFFEKDDIPYRKSVLTTGWMISLFVTGLLLIILFTWQMPLSELFFADRKFSHLITLAGAHILLSVLSAILSLPIRLENKRKVYVLSHLITSILSYVLSIWLLVNNWNYMAIPVTNFVISLCSCLFYLWYGRKWFFPVKINIPLIKDLVHMGIPVMIALLTYWIFHSCDRIMISNMLGTDANGVYAVGNKIASVSHFIFSAFTGGWSYFTFSTMKEKDQVETASNIMQWLGAISFFALGLACLVYKFVFTLLFEGDYAQGYIVFPYLFLSPLIQMLFTVSGSQLLIIKKTHWETFGLLVGVVGSVLLNFLLIPRFGIKGAALATLVGYLISLIVIILFAVQKKMLTVNRRFIACCAAAVIVCVHIFIWDNVWSLFLSALLCIITLVLYWNDLLLFVKMAVDFLKRKRVSGKAE